MRFSWLPASLLALSSTCAASTGRETFDESLRIESLPDGKVHSHFEFIIKGPLQQGGASRPGLNSIATHHSVLPSSLLALLSHYHITSFSLTLSSGRWESTWPLLATPSSPIRSTPASGIELVGWVELLAGEKEGDEDERWNRFQGALGGLFCTGIIGGKAGRGEGRPRWGYPFVGDGDEREHKLYRSVLPRLSATCTESLAPFLAMLPCSSHAGLSSLLNPHKLFDGDWTLLGIHFVHEEGDKGTVRLEVGSVVDPVRHSRLKGGLGSRDFSMKGMFDRGIEKSCPVARSSEVQLIVPRGTNAGSFSISPEMGKSDRMERKLQLAVWDTRTVPDGGLDVAVRWSDEGQFKHPHPSTLPLAPISARRLLTGYGQERGSIGVELTNNLDRAADVIWIETWPWWLRGFIGTLTEELMNSSLPIGSSKMIQELSYTPPIARQRPTTLQTYLTLPPHSTSRFSISYENSYLWYTEYPSDAHRGFEVPGALVILLCPPSSPSSNQTVRDRRFLDGRGQELRIHTPSTLLELPTPDFSMPYNVIIMTSTIMALFFGHVMNGLVRKWVVVDVGEVREELEMVEGKSLEI